MNVTVWSGLGLLVVGGGILLTGKIAYAPWFLTTSVIAASPADQLARIEALQAASAANEHEEVVALAKQIVAVDPGRADAWYLLGLHAEQLGLHDMVISASRRAWALGYRYMPNIAVRIASSAAALDDKELAYEWLQKALDEGMEDRQRLADLEAFAKYRDDPAFRAIAAMPRGEETRVTGLRRDVDLLVKEAQRIHTGPDRPAFGTPFLDAAARIKARATELTDPQVLWELSRLTALLGDGHSVVYGPIEGSPLRVPSAMLPIRVYLFKEGLYVIDANTPEAEPLVGQRITKVGERTPEQLLAASREIHGVDNEMTMCWMGPQFYFANTHFLEMAGAINDPATVTLTMDGGKKEISEVTLEPGDYPLVRKLRPSDAIRGEVPLYLRNVDGNYWMEPLPDHAALYFQFNQVRDADEESIAEFARRLGRALENGGVKNLILDVRHNNGGNNSLVWPLLRQIVAFDVRPGTRVFVITGRNTFSAAQNFISRLERMVDGAVFVGEPSSSSPNFTGEETQLVLPWSRVTLSISSRYWQESDPGDDRAWIGMHIPVEPTAADYFAGRDAALASIQSLLTP